MKKKAFYNVLSEYFQSPEGQTILTELLNKALTRQMTFEQHRDGNGNAIVPPKTKTETVNVIDQLLIYLSRTEGSWRGVQIDLNTYTENTKHLTEKFIEEQRRVANAFKLLAKAINDSPQLNSDSQRLKAIGE